MSVTPDIAKEKGEGVEHNATDKTYKIDWLHLMNTLLYRKWKQLVHLGNSESLA